MDNNETLTNPTQEVVISDSSTPTLTDPSPTGVIASLSENLQSKAQESDATIRDTNPPLTDPLNDTSLQVDSTPSPGGTNHGHSGPALTIPWQDLLISMASELGLVESSRMMAAEELVLSTTQRKNAPGIIQKFSKLLQESVAEQGESTESTAASSSGSSKRNNTGAMDVDDESLEIIKRRRVDDVHGTIQENATREEIEGKMLQFMAAKREQINESNRQEFIKGRVPVSDTGAGSEEPTDDDGCARVDARKLNRTIQMRLETIKNEALTKTNPKTHTHVSDTNMASNGLDERLRNIQVHLNLRIAAVPACTIAERIRIVEDVIIQLERDYPMWSALHFNQPNRAFPPPPSVTTVSRNARNQIVISGDHLHTTLIENGDPIANPAILAQQAAGTSRSISGSQLGSAQRQGIVDANMRAGSTAAVNDGKGGVLTELGRPGVASPVGTGGSATVIKLKRHGGAGSSSLARAVQQQLAQRKANAASGGQTADDLRNNGSTPAFKINSASYQDSIKSGSTSAHMSIGGTTPGGSLSPTITFADTLKPGVTGRGPIKSRRKSIAKGLDPASAMASMSVAHTGNILGSNPGAALTGGSATSSQSGQSGEASLGSFSVSKPKSTTVKKPRKKKGEDNGDESTPTVQGSRAGGGRGKGGFGLGKGGFGLGKGKGGGRPMGLGLGKGKGGAYREELLRRAEVEEFDDNSDEDIDGDNEFEWSNANAAPPSSTGNGALTAGNGTTFLNDTSALAHLVSSALKDQANAAAQAQARHQEQQQQAQAVKSKKQPRKPSTPAKPPPVRKFGGKSFGMAGGESSGSSSNESSDGEGTGSSGSQSDSSSTSGISGSDAEDSD